MAITRRPMPASHIAITCALAAAIIVAASACGGSDSGDNTPTPDAAQDTFDRNALLRNIGENIIIPTYQRFVTQARDMSTAVDAYCDALAGEQETTARQAAQEAWNAAMDTWQLAEVMRFGPVAMDDRRDFIYSWNVISSCAVDQDVNQYRLTPDDYDITARLSNRRGLDALEAVLFRDELAHSCPSQAAPEGWDDLAADEQTAARCRFAIVAADDLAVQAESLLDAWDSDGGNYIEMFATASAFDSAQAAVNVVSDAMFYLDTETKDMKVAEPAGIADNVCNSVGEPCFDELESPFAARSKEHVLANLRAVDMLLSGRGLDGDDGVGFDEFLRAVGANELADSMAAATSEAIAAVEAITPSLRASLSSADGYADVVTAHERIRALTTLIKSQFLTVLGLELPESGGADND